MVPRVSWVNPVGLRGERRARFHRGYLQAPRCGWRRAREGYPEFGCRPSTPQKDTFAAKILHTPPRFLFVPSPEYAPGERETRRSHVPGGAPRAVSRALRGRGSPPEATPRPASRPKAFPSLPGHAHRRANSPGSRSGALARLSESWIHFLAPRPAPALRPPPARRVPRGPSSGSGESGAAWTQGCGSRCSSRLPRALLHPGSCVSTFPTARPGRTLRPPGRGGCSRGPGRSPGREGYPAEGRASYQRPAATALGGAQPHPRGGPRPASARAASPPGPARPPSSAQSPPAAAAPFVWAAGANQWRGVGGAQLGQ